MAIDIGPPQNLQNFNDLKLWVDGLYNWIISRESSDGLGFMQSGTGAVVRTVQNRMRDVISVKDFGAVGNGSTDDTTAVQNAINAAISAGGATVFFPQTSNGEYLISTKLSVSGKVVLKGDGQYHTRILCNDCDGIEIAAGVTGGKISDIEVAHGVRYTTTANTHVGLKFAGSTGSRPFYNIVSDVFFDGFGTAIETNWLWSTEFRNAHTNYCHIGFYMKGLGCNNTINSCKIVTDGSAGSRGLLLGDGTNPSEGLIVSDSLIYYGEENIEAIAFGQSCITNCIIDYGRKYGIDIRSSATDMCTGWQISNNYIALEGADGVNAIHLYNNIDSVQNMGNRIIGNYIHCYDGSAADNGIAVSGDYADNNIIMGNSILGFDTTDINIAEGAGNIVIGNQCISPAATYNIYSSGGIVLGNVAAVVSLSATTSEGVSGYRYGSATPVGAVTPGYVGEEYLDTNAAPKQWYKAVGLTNSDWVALN